MRSSSATYLLLATAAATLAITNAIGCKSPSSGSPGTVDGGSSSDGASPTRDSGPQETDATTADDGNILDGGSPSDAALGPDAIAAGPHAAVRVLDLADPTLLDVDVCFSTDALGPTTSWVGPMLRGTYTFLDNSAVSPYLNVPAGTRSLRLVLFDTADCSETLAGIPDFALKTTLAAGSRSTIVLAGTGFDAGPEPLQALQYADIVEPADGGNYLRMINVAQAQGAIDIYAYGGNNTTSPCTMLYSNIAYGGVGVASAIPGDAGPTAADGYTPLGGENLYNLCFNYTMGFVVHGGDCTKPFSGIYSTDYVLSQGAWSFFIYDENYMRVICRDDGTVSSLCEQH